ncbi:3-hydroxyacyl-CoA dehydratase, partial [Ophiophagus hannah]
MCIFGFLAHGHGAKGDNIYTFQIEFLEPVNPQLVYKVTQRQLSITVKKKESHWWERLTKQEKRPLFLAPDFDRWLDESDAELELKAKVSLPTLEERLSVHVQPRAVPGLFMDLCEHDCPAVHARERQVAHILVPFLVSVPKGLEWLFYVLADSFSDTFHMSGDMMYFCQMFALMEIVNALIGLVRAPLAPVCIQIFGRNFILFVVLGNVEEMQSKAVVFFIFYIWSMVEIIRPFNLSFLLLGVAVIQAIPIFTSTGKFSFTLNYPLNITVPFSIILQLYLIFFFLAPFILFRHLYKQRQRRLGPKKRKMH